MIVTHPGKFGDILWALPTVRAIAASYGPVEFQVSEAFGDPSFVALLDAQPYITRVVVRTDWMIRETAPITPCHPPPSAYERTGETIHLGYQGWPSPDLPRAAYAQANATLRAWGQHELVPLDLDTPWVIAATPLPPEDDWQDLAQGWTDEWFELKVGLTHLVEALEAYDVVCRAGSRWEREAGFQSSSWLDAARAIDMAWEYVGDCSALHVLALALGKNVVLVEPSPHRHNPVFYPYGMDGPRVTVVRGNDGLPTFDARHVREVLDAQ